MNNQSLTKPQKSLLPKKKLDIIFPMSNWKFVVGIFIASLIIGVFISFFQITTVYTEANQGVDNGRIVLSNAIYMTFSVFLTWGLIEYFRPKLEYLTFVVMLAWVLFFTVLVNVALTFVINYLFIWFSIKEVSVTRLIVEVLANTLIAMSIVALILYYFDLYCKVIEHSKADLKSQIYQLESRLNPSFFFNSLNALHTVIDIDKNEAKNLLENISQFYQQSLRESKLIKLKDEIKICELYVQIESTRIQNNIQLTWQNNLNNNDIKLAEIGLPSMCVQSVIEMLVGYNEDNKTLKIRCSIDYEHGSILIKVLGENIISYDYDSFNLKNQFKLTNLNHRIKRYYGDTAEVDMINLNEQYIMVNISFPFLVFD